MHHPTDRIIRTTAFVTPVMEREIAQCVHPMKDRSDDTSHHERTLLPRSYISLPFQIVHVLQGQNWTKLFISRMSCGSVRVRIWMTVGRGGGHLQFHKAILPTIYLSYLRLILRLPALIFTSVQRNNFKTIVNPAHVDFCFCRFFCLFI